MTDPFEMSGPTEDMSADDLLREICGDVPGVAIISEETASQPAQASGATTQQTATSDTGDDYLENHSGQYFVWDLETYPDESRFPRPEVTLKPVQNIDLEKLVSGTVEQITKVLKSNVLHEDQIESIRELEIAGKSRATVFSEVDKAIANLDGEFEKWKREGSLNPWKGRIVAFSWSFIGEEEIHVMLAKDLDEERAILAKFWQLMEVGTRVGFNTKEFDDKWIVARSMILRVDASRPMDVGRYSRDSIDIMQKLLGNPVAGLDCKTLAMMLGIPIPAEGIEGSSVFSIVESGDWDLLQKYVSSDVFVEKEMFRRMKRYVRV